MIYSGLHFRKMQKRNIFSFDANLILNSIDGSGLLGFSGEGNSFNFKFINGKIFDPEERFTSSYQADKSVNISGNISGSSYDYYINKVLFCKNGSKTNFNAEKFLIQTFDTSVDLEINLASAGSGNLSISSLPAYFESGIPFSGKITNGGSGNSFDVFSGQVLYPTFLSGGIEMINLPLKVDGETGAYLKFLPTANIETDNYFFDINFHTSFGEVRKQFPISGLKTTSVYNLSLGLINSTMEQEINFTKIKQPNLKTEKTYMASQSLFVNDVSKSGLSEQVSLSYFSGVTGIIDGIIINASLENGGSGYFNNTLIKTTNNSSDDCSDFGKTWVKKSIDSKKPWEEIVLSDDGARIIASQGLNGVFISTNSGETWNKKTIDLDTNAFFYGNAITSSSNGEKLIVANYPGYIYTSNNYGETWIKRLNSGSRSWYTVACSSDGTKIIASDSVYIYTSIDFGETWTTRLTEKTRNWLSVDISSDGTKMFAVALNDYLYISSDSGVTWIVKHNDIERDWCSIKCSSDGLKLMALALNNYAFSSSDSGETWKKHKGMGKHFWLSLDLSSNGKKIIITDNDKNIYTTVNEGRRWRIRQNANGSLPLGSICVSSDGKKIAAIEHDGYAYVSKNECDEIGSTAGDAACLLGIPNSYGEITGISILNAGFDYLENVDLDFSFNATGIKILSSGSGYVGSPNFLISGSEGNPASGFFITNASGQIYDYVFRDLGFGFFSHPNTVDVYSTLDKINILNSGFGFSDNFDLSFSGGGGSEASASGLVNFSVKNVTITNEGRFYESLPSVVFSGQEIVPASGTALMLNGFITGVNITNPGLYKNSKPSLFFSGGNPLYAANGLVNSSGSVTGVLIASNGNGYTGIPNVSYLNTLGTGAEFKAVISSGAEIEVLYSSGAKGSGIKGSYLKDFKNVFNLHTGLNQNSLLNFKENNLFNTLTQSYENNIIYLGSNQENMYVKVEHINGYDDFPLVGLLTVKGSGNSISQEKITGLR